MLEFLQGVSISTSLGVLQTFDTTDGIFFILNPTNANYFSRL